MSDFYRRRRIMIKDSTALMMFFVGFVWSGAFVWPILANGVDDGSMMRGLAYFLTAVLGAGIIAGVIGLETGDVLGGFWERYHRQHRQAGTSPPDGGHLPRHGQIPTRATSGPSTTDCQIDPARIQITGDGVYAASYLELAARVRPDRLEVPRLRGALTKTTNIGAWDGGRLVGAVRVLSDGYTFSAVADIIVDPAYQGFGVGRRLMDAAFASALASNADGRLFVEALPECAGFFERVGCDRGRTGFVMTHRVASA